MSMLIHVSDDEVATAIRAGDLDLLAILTFVISDDPECDTLVAVFEETATGSRAEKTVPDGLRTLADAIEQFHEDAA